MPFQELSGIDQENIQENAPEAVLVSEQRLHQRDVPAVAAGRRAVGEHHQGVHPVVLQRLHRGAPEVPLPVFPVALEVVERPLHVLASGGDELLLPAERDVGVGVEVELGRLGQRLEGAAQLDVDHLFTRPTRSLLPHRAGEVDQEGDASGEDRHADEGRRALAVVALRALLRRSPVGLEGLRPALPRTGIGAVLHPREVLQQLDETPGEAQLGFALQRAHQDQDAVAIAAARAPLCSRSQAAAQSARDRQRGKRCASSS